MKVYTVTLRIEADEDVTAEQIREDVHDAGSDAGFGFGHPFTITTITEEKP